MTTATKTTASKSAAKAAAPVTTDAITEHVGTAIQTCCDLALKGLEAQRQVTRTVFDAAKGQPDPLEVRARTESFVEGLFGILETSISDTTEVAKTYVDGMIAAGTVDGGTPKDFAEVGTRIEKTVGDLTGLNRSTTEQVIEMTTRQAKGFEALVRDSLPATTSAVAS